MSRFRASIFLQWKINKYYIFLVCTFSLIYSAYNAWRHIVMCGLSGCAVFFHIKCFFWFSLKIVIRYIISFPIFRITERGMDKNIHYSSYNVPFILSMFNEASIFSTYLKNAQIRFFIKIHPVDTKLFIANTFTDTAKLYAQ